MAPNMPETSEEKIFGQFPIEETVKSHNVRIKLVYPEQKKEERKWISI